MEDKPVLNQKGRYQLQYRGLECLNCGHPLAMNDRFCPNCSQANSTRKLSMKDFVEELFGSLLSYDSKILRTLSALLTRPGKITRDYIDGKRIAYTNPFRFLLSLAIMYFLILNLGGDFSGFDRFAPNEGSGRVNIKDGILNLPLGNDHDAQIIRDSVITSLDSIQGLEWLTESERKKDSTIISDPKGYYTDIKKESFLGTLASKSEFFITLLRKKEISAYDQLGEKFEIPNSLENRMAFNIARSFIKVEKQPSAYISSLISKLPFAIFFFLPVFAIFIWMVYIRKKYSYTDHLIFSFHNTSLFFILLLISYLIDWIFNINSNWIFLMVFSAYLFYAMKKFYAQGIFKTIVKYLFLNMIFFILASIAILVLSTGSLITY